MACNSASRSAGQIEPIAGYVEKTVGYITYLKQHPARWGIAFLQSLRDIENVFTAMHVCMIYSHTIRYCSIIDTKQRRTHAHQYIRHQDLPPLADLQPTHRPELRPLLLDGPVEVADRLACGGWGWSVFT
jgi:hypothetical protein